MFVFLGSLQQMVFASQQVLWSVPQTVLYIGLTVSCGFLGKWLLLQKRFCGGFCQLFFTFVSQSPAVFWGKWLLLHKSSLEGSANCALHLSPSLLLGAKLRELLTCLTHTNPVRRKWPIMSLLLGYSLGLFLVLSKSLLPCTMIDLVRSWILLSTVHLKIFCLEKSHWPRRYQSFNVCFPVCPGADAGTSRTCSTDTCTCTTSFVSNPCSTCTCRQGISCNKEYLM